MVLNWHVRQTDCELTNRRRYLNHRAVELRKFIGVAFVIAIVAAELLFEYGTNR